MSLSRIFPLRETLEFIKHYLPTGLVSGPALMAVMRMAKLLPDAASAFILECRLAEDSDTVDLSVSIPGTKAGHDNLLAWINPMVESPSLRLIREFCVQWANENSALHDNVSVVWLEFDVPGEHHTSLPNPSIFFGIRPIPHVCSANTCAFDLRTTQLTINRALNILVGDSLGLNTNRNLRRCLNSIPSEGRVAEIGVMLSRPSNAIRLCAKMPKWAVSRYLTRVKWPGSICRVTDALSRIGHFANTVLVDLDIGCHVFPTIGIEFSFHSLPDRDPKLKLFLDALVADGLCTTTKGRDLWSWQGSSYEVYPNVLFPRILCRKLSHIKINCHSGHPDFAKAYLWFSPTVESFSA